MERKMAKPKCPICNKKLYCSNPSKYYCSADMSDHYFHFHPEKGMRLTLFGEIPFSIYNMPNEDPPCYVVIESSSQEKAFSWEEFRPYDEKTIKEIKQLVYSSRGK